MQSVRIRWRNALRLTGVVAALGAGCHAEDLPTPHSQDLRVSEEVYRMFCMRVARDEYPASPDGREFEAACEGRGQPMIPVAAESRLKALFDRREALLDALDQVFAEGSYAQSPVPDQAQFADKELHDFLGSLIPYYDDGTMPGSTRALAKVADKLLNEGDPRARRVLDTFARLSPRVGYRSQPDVLAAVRPMLRYPNMDRMSQELLGFVGEGGPGHEALLGVLDAALLELAEPGEPVADQDADKTTLHTVTDLLFRQDPLAKPEDPSTSSFAAPSDPAKWFVLRDNKANAVLLPEAQQALAEQMRPPPGAPPFALANRPDTIQRDQHGRAFVQNNAGKQFSLYDYRDANRTLLAALLRDQKAILERKDGRKAAAENLLRGIRVIVGETIDRAETFRKTDGQPTMVSFKGPDVERSPLLHLTHGMTNLLRYPETQRVVKLLRALLSDKAKESAAAAPVYAGLQIDKRADNHPMAQLMGIDGQPGGKQEFWDDLLEIGMRMAQRPGLFRDVIEEFAKPEGAAQARLMALFMKHKDEVKYVGHPLSIGADGKYTQADADKMNTPITHQLKEQVVRMPGYDVGMNRSLFQRLISTIQGTNGSPNCNKEGAVATVHGPTGDLKFPNADSIQMSLVGCALDPEIGAVSAYPLCKFVEQPNGAEAHMRSMLGKTVAQVKDDQLRCAAAAEIPLVKQKQDIGKEQEASSQIKGFTLTPTPESIARFMYAPRNKFVSDLFDPMPTLHGMPLVDYEPNMLFALEAKQDAVKIGAASQSFLDASKGLTGAFDKHQEFEVRPEVGEVAKGGYMFADLLSVLHMHWSSRKNTACPIANPAMNPVCAMLKLDAKACNAGCTQGLDPSKPFYSKQSNLVSYEPLLVEAFEDERLADLLAMSTQVLKTITIDGKNGVEILGEFAERMLKPEPGLTYYKEKGFSEPRKFAYTNTCVPSNDPKAPTCQCPAGATPVDNKPASACKMPSGAIVPRGRIIAQTTPLHLILDALNEFDAAFADPAHPEYAERLKPWREARSVLVDTFLTATKTPDPKAPMDATKATYAMANPRARAVGVTLLDWLDARIELYRCQPRAKPTDPCVADEAALNNWVKGLPDRLSSTLGHPLFARALDLFDVLWKPIEDTAGDAPAREMAAFNSYLMDPNSPENFAGVVLAAADTLSIVDRDRELSPAIQFAALAIAENAFEALDNGAKPATNQGTAVRALEVTRKVADLQRGNPNPSAISKLLKNAVLNSRADGPNRGRAPLEVLVDAIADVNREVPSKPTVEPHTYGDNRKVFDQLKFFLSDQERGLERLYNVIANRKVQN